MEKKKFIAYCVKCKKKVQMKNPAIVERGKFRFLRGECPFCGTSVWRVISRKK